ncbi:MAG: hypothetical protein EB084_10615 [Proteobacteria bacterium]|nr:hypothetical protein [Pseudomonadota bacterium]
MVDNGRIGGMPVTAIAFSHPRPVVPQRPLPLVPQTSGVSGDASSKPQVSLSSRVEATLSSGLQSLQALPSFLYPAVTGTAAEKAIIHEALGRLPLKDVSAISSVQMVPWIGPHDGNGVILGVTRPATEAITLSRGGCAYSVIGGDLPPGVSPDSVNPDMLRYTMLHEAGHAHDFGGGLTRMLTRGELSRQAPFGQAPFLTDYAGTSPREDFAEAHAHYFESTKELQRVPGLESNRTLSEMDPKRHEVIKKSLEPSFLERLVDHTPFREAGKQIGEWSSSAPVTRSALQVATTLSSMLLITDGATEMLTNLGKDKLNAVHGALGLAAGVGLALTYASPLLGPAALGALGARRGIEVAGQRGVASAGAATAAATGGAIGGLVGGIAGPLGGTVLGYTVGGPVGGAIGFIAGSLTGLQGGSTLGARAGLALARAA